MEAKAWANLLINNWEALFAMLTNIRTHQTVHLQLVVPCLPGPRHQLRYHHGLPPQLQWHDGEGSLSAEGRPKGTPYRHRMAPASPVGPAGTEDCPPKRTADGPWWSLSSGPSSPCQSSSPPTQSYRWRRSWKPSTPPSCCQPDMVTGSPLWTCQQEKGPKCFRLEIGVTPVTVGRL